MVAMKNLINTEVYHGSPYLENLEVIVEIIEGDELKTIQFDSGFFTRMTHKEFDTFCEEGEIQYVRMFADQKAYESMFLANPNH